MLRLHLPRHLLGGKQAYLYLGLADTPINRQAATTKAQVIAADIAFDRFDPTLEKYKPQYNQQQKDESLPLKELWTQYEEFKARSLSVTTIEKDFKRVGNHIAALPHNLSAKQVRKHLTEALSVATAKKVLMQIKACCQWASEEELITANPFATVPNIRGGKPKKGINPFTREERDLIIKAFEDHEVWNCYASFVKFLFWTGCRTSEAVGLQWKHIASNLNTITFSEAVVEGNRKDTKTHVIRKFPVNRTLRQLLSDIRPANPDHNDPVFRSQKNLTIDAHNFLNRAWKAVLAKLPIEYRPQYNTRHTFISLCLENGVQVVQISSWVGNSPKTIWQHYAGLVSQSEVPD